MKKYRDYGLMSVWVFLSVAFWLGFFEFIDSLRETNVFL